MNFDVTAKTYWKTKIENQKARLRENVTWFPMPAFISFGLILVFTGHLLMGLNPRMGNPAHLVEHDSTPEPEGSMWLSISADSKDLIITTFDREVFTYPIEELGQQELIDFRKYLKAASFETMVGNILEKRIRESKTTIVLAVDQHLTYFHLRPVIRALSKVGFNHFNFETRLSRR